MDAQDKRNSGSDQRVKKSRQSSCASSARSENQEPPSRQSNDIVLAPEDLIHASNPNVVLTNPIVLKHLQQLHERAKRKANEFTIDDDIEERRKQLRLKVDTFNRRSQVGAFRVKIIEESDELTYSGPLRFFYRAPGASSENFRMMTLSDRDCVRDIIPTLRQRFAVPPNVRCSLREVINGDEILLDPDDRPLELAVNSKSPLTFHLVTGGDRNAELLQNLRNDKFTPEQRRRFIEKYNLTGGKEFDDEDDKISVTSSSSTPHRRTSLSGSSTGSIKRAVSRRKTASPLLVAAMAKLNGYGGSTQKVNAKQTEDPLDSSPAHRPSNRKKLTRAHSASQLKSATLSTAPVVQKSDAAARTGRMRSIKQKNKNATVAHRREPRSSSGRRLFFSLRKNRARSASRERPSGANDSGGNAHESEESSSPGKNAELSSNVHLPGILKIFGDAVSPGANYKSVMATRQSEACELVKMALQRYGVARQQAKHYVLCEVVGRVSDTASNDTPTALKVKAGKHKQKSGPQTVDIDASWSGAVNFVEDYIRPLNDYEKPLILQSYWKPLDGHCRRFELRRRSQVFKKGEKDHATRDINNQARRLVLQKSRNALVRSQAETLPQTDSEDDSDREDFGEKGTMTSESVVLGDVVTQPAVPATTETIATAPAKKQTSREDGKKSPDRARAVGDVRTESVSTTTSKSEDDDDTLASPCLITLQGDSPDVVHYLTLPETLIGRKASDVKLTAPDIASHHCVIKRRVEIMFDERDSCDAAKRWCVTISPLNSKAEVTANGRRLTSEYTLQHGDVVAIGKHYLFLYKDPMSNVDLSHKFSFPKVHRNGASGPKTGSTAPQREIVSPDRKAPGAQASWFIETELNYALECEDLVLGEIFGAAQEVDNNPLGFTFAPAALLCHCIVHSSLNFRLEHKNDLLLKIASNLQTLVLNATRNVSIQEIQSPSDPGNNLNVLLPALRPVVYWMSNSLEIFEFLQKNLIPIIQKRVREERIKKEVDAALLDEAEQFEVNEEILALLEEVVMYAFQQLVYYLTKMLYSLLPAVLDCNPFAEPTSAVRVEHVTEVFESAREMSRTFDVDQHITDQLFAYLFFFTNVSLFNTLMEDESTSRYYRWEMGARIRGNLELVESWATDTGYSEQCSTFLEKISALANLLATPRTQITKHSWASFRKAFPVLHPAQLKRVLEHYRLTAGHSKPLPWTPDLAEMDEALDKNLWMESYENHPPLMLPVNGTSIQFDKLPTNEQFRDLVELVKNVGNPRMRDRGESPPSSTAVRQQPEGREKSISDVAVDDVISSSPEALSSKCDVNSSSKSSVSNRSERHLTETASTAGVGRFVSSSSCSSSSSEPEGYVIRQHRSRHSLQNSIDRVSPSQAINELIDSNSKIPSAASEEREKDCDDLLVLPVSETPSMATQVSRNKTEARSPSADSSNYSITSQGSAQGMPKEVFIVDIKKGRNGLGVGLVDGSKTSLDNPGVFVRSLVPDIPGMKHGHSKRHDVIRCWLQEGRLQLGDRILAANGVSLLNMSYSEATRTVRQAGDYVRLLVGRCGAEVAIKITSSSC